MISPSYFNIYFLSSLNKYIASNVEFNFSISIKLRDITLYIIYISNTLL